MLIQTPSQIFKADFSVWKNKGSALINPIVSAENGTENLLGVTEIILAENGSFEIASKENSTLIILTLFGKIKVNQSDKIISSEDVFTLKSEEKKTVKIENALKDEKSDFLIIELAFDQPEDTFYIEDLNITEYNALIPISKKSERPNFIGLYDGRREEFYAVKSLSKTIFGMVINGAFEFQNRLLETRDSILLRDIDTLEFEALSENALIIFLEV